MSSILHPGRSRRDVVLSASQPAAATLTGRLTRATTASTGRDDADGGSHVSTCEVSQRSSFRDERVAWVAAARTKEET